MPNNIAFLTKKVTNYVTFYAHVMIKVMLMFFGLKFANNKRRTRQCLTLVTKEIKIKELLVKNLDTTIIIISDWIRFLRGCR